MVVTMRLKKDGYYWVVKDGKAVDFGKLLLVDKRGTKSQMKQLMLESTLTGFLSVDKKLLEPAEKNSVPKYYPKGYNTWRAEQIDILGKEPEVEEIDCEDCDGRGDYTCGECDSVLECKACDGEGYIEQDQFSKKVYLQQIREDVAKWVDYHYNIYKTSNAKAK